MFIFLLSLFLFFLSFLTSVPHPACGNPGDKVRNSSPMEEGPLRRHWGQGLAAEIRGEGSWVPPPNPGAACIGGPSPTPQQEPFCPVRETSGLALCPTSSAKNQVRQQCDQLTSARETTDGKGLMYLASRNILHHNWTLSGYVTDLQRDGIFMLEYSNKKSECGGEYQGQGEPSLCFSDHSFIHFCQQSLSTYSAVGNELVAKAHRWKAMVPVSQGLKSTPRLSSTQPRYIFVLERASCVEAGSAWGPFTMQLPWAPV